MWPNPQETADLVTFTEEILTGKLHFLCSVWRESMKILQCNVLWLNYLRNIFTQAFCVRWTLIGYKRMVVLLKRLWIENYQWCHLQSFTVSQKHICYSKKWKLGGKVKNFHKKLVFSSLVIKGQWFRFERVNLSDVNIYLKICAMIVSFWKFVMPGFQIGDFPFLWV